MTRRLAAAALAIGLVGALVLGAAGCKGGSASPRGVATAYLGYMRAEKYLEAAKLWDYEEYARRENEDWDNLDKGKRNLIIGKLAEDKASSLKQWSGYFPGAAKITNVQESGDTAFAEVEGARVGRIDLVKIGEEWKVSGMS